MLALAGLTVMASQRANAASAVAIGDHLLTTRAYGVMFTVEEARRTALELAQKRGYKNVRILASTSQ